MKKIILFFLLLLPTLAMAQLYVVNVESLCGKGDYGWECVVTKNTAESPSFLALAKQLKQHSNKSMAKAAQDNLKKHSSIPDVDETVAKLNQMVAMGYISKAEADAAKASLVKEVQGAKAAAASLAHQAGAGVASDPNALKESIRQNCVGSRFYRHVGDEIGGVRRVDVGNFNLSLSGVNTALYCGFIDAVTGEVILEPDRYAGFNMRVGSALRRFSVDGFVIGHLRDKSGKYIAAEMIDRNGNIILSGYEWLSFYTDCRLLKASREGKYGIIDYSGNVLEPFIHNDPKAEGLFQAKNRIMKEKGLPKLKLF